MKRVREPHAKQYSDSALEWFFESKVVLSSGFFPKFLKSLGTIRDRPNTVSESTVSNTELSEFFCPHRVLERELSEFLSAYYLCAKVNSPSFSQNSPSSLFRNSTLQRMPWGGGKRGGWKTSRLTPLPKRGFGPPLVRYVFHPPQVSVLCFSCTKIHDRADQKLFWRGPKIFGRARSLVRFPPPIRFATPPYHGPILW